MDEMLIKAMWFDMLSAARLDVGKATGALAQAQKEIADLKEQIAKKDAEPPT